MVPEWSQFMVGRYTVFEQMSLNSMSLFRIGFYYFFLLKSSLRKIQWNKNESGRLNTCKMLGARFKLLYFWLWLYFSWSKLRYWGSRWHNFVCSVCDCPCLLLWSLTLFCCKSWKSMIDLTSHTDTNRSTSKLDSVN